MTPGRLIGQRIANHGLARPRFDTPADVVSWYGALQGQEYGPAKWGLAQRTSSLTNRTLDAAFDAGELLRTHLLRPTWQFVGPRDLHWMQKLTSPRVHAGNASVYRSLELTPRLMTRAADLMARALEGRNFLTRQELAAVLARRRIPAKSQRLAYIVMFAELEAIICSGPRRGKQFTYALAAERVRKGPALAGDEALSELTRRYFRSHGPATIRDFMWWSSLRAGDAKRGVALTGLKEDRLDGLTLWSVEPKARPARSIPSIRLLPIYDEYFVAYRDRSYITTRLEGLNLFANHLVMDGRLIGSWRVTDGDVVIRPHAVMDERHVALAAREVKRYRRFIGIS